MGLGSLIKSAVNKVGELFSIKSKMGWVGLGLGALAAGLTVIQAIKQRKMMREARRDASIREVHPSQSGAVIPILYGRCATNGMLVYSQVGSTLSDVDSTDPSVIGTLAAGSSDRNAYLLAQWVLSVGKISELRGVHVEGDSIEGSRLSGTAVVDVTTWNTSNAMASSFTGERTINSYFGDLGYVTGAFHLDVDDPKYSGSPYPTFFVDGSEVKSIENTAGVFSLSTLAKFKYTPPLVLLDYLVVSKAGPQIPVAQIDLESFQQAAAISGRKVLGSGSDIWNNKYPARNREFTGRFTRWRDYLKDRGFTSIADNDLIASGIFPTPTGITLLHHEFHGAILTNETYQDVIAGQILPTMPGAILAHGVDGKYKLSLPDPEVGASTASVGTIDEAMLMESVTVTYPGADVRRNRLVCRYGSANKDYALDSVTFPTAGSALHTTWLAADGDRPLEETIDLPHTITRPHACALASNQILLSRRTLFNGILTFDALVYEQGDVVELVDVIMGIDTYVRILDIRLREDQTVSFEAIEYSPADYDFYLDAETTIPMQDSVDFVATVPTSATTTFDKANGLTKVDWTMPSKVDVGLSHFEIQEQLDTDDWVTVAHPNRGDLAWVQPWIPLQAKKVKHRIRSVTL